MTRKEASMPDRVTRRDVQRRYRNAPRLQELLDLLNAPEPPLPPLAEPLEANPLMLLMAHAERLAREER